MLRMVSYPRRLKSGQITCYLNRTYHLLTTPTSLGVDEEDPSCQHHLPGGKSKYAIIYSGLSGMLTGLSGVGKYLA